MSALVGPLLLGFGAAGIIGNVVAGVAVARGVHRTVLAIVLALAAVLALHALLDTGAAGGVALLLLWRLAYGGVSVSLQSWMIAAALFVLAAVVVRTGRRPVASTNRSA